MAITPSRPDPFLNDVERAIYEAGCRDLMRAILAARSGGDTGTVALVVGLHVVQATIRVRNAAVKNDLVRQVVVRRTLESAEGRA